MFFCTGTDLSTAERAGMLPSLPHWLERSTDCIWAASVSLSLLHSVHRLSGALAGWQAANANAAAVTAEPTNNSPATSSTDDSAAVPTSAAQSTGVDMQDAIYRELDASMLGQEAAAQPAPAQDAAQAQLATAQQQVLVELISVTKAMCDLLQALPCALGRSLDKRVDAGAGLASALLALAKMAAQRG